jgi:hypothetical protein
MEDRTVNAWWLVPPVILVLFYIHTRTTLLIDGILAIVVGLVVALDIGGAAATVPVPMRWTWISLNGSRRAARRAYAMVVLWGFIVLGIALK